LDPPGRHILLNEYLWSPVPLVMALRLSVSCKHSSVVLMDSSTQWQLFSVAH